MAIKPPSWAKNAVPTINGWKDPRTGELLKSTKLSQDDIDGYMGVAPTPLAPAPVVEADAPNDWDPADVDGDGVVDDLETLSKVELEELGRDNGVELDRRKSRKSLIGQMRTLLNT
jgi:hypothetical protein|tara:strand:- start:1154 stop:1501 length:348 start_codon:yes stop_codon:yes gene_type:complete